MTTWMNPEGITLSEINQREEDKQAWYHLYVESKKKKTKLKLKETESRKVVAWDWGWGKQGEVGKRVQTFSYKMNKV